MRSSTTADQVAHATEVEQENAVTGANDGGPTFEGHIKSLFRERDRVAMLAFFDLWSFDDVKANADAILAAVGTGSMPCDTPWSTKRVDLLERWVDSGTPR
jgi:hypothetical protein